MALGRFFVPQTAQAVKKNRRSAPGTPVYCPDCRSLGQGPTSLAGIEGRSGAARPDCRSLGQGPTWNPSSTSRHAERNVPIAAPSGRVQHREVRGSRPGKLGRSRLPLPRAGSNIHWDERRLVGAEVVPIAAPSGRVQHLASFNTARPISVGPDCCSLGQGPTLAHLWPKMNLRQRPDCCPLGQGPTPSRHSRQQTYPFRPDCCSLGQGPTPPGRRWPPGAYSASRLLLPRAGSNTSRRSRSTSSSRNMSRLLLPRAGSNTQSGAARVRPTACPDCCSLGQGPTPSSSSRRQDP